MLGHDLRSRKELRGRSDHARLFEHDRGVVVELAIVAGVADAADRAFDAQLLGATEQVPVPPETFDPEPLGVGVGRTDAVVALLALAHFDADRDCAVAVEFSALLNADAVEDAEIEQAVPRVLDLLRRVGVAALQAGHIACEVAIDLVGSFDRGVAIAGDRPGLDGERHVECRGRMVGDDVAVGHLGKRAAFFLQRSHDERFRLQHGVGACIAPGDEPERGRYQIGCIALQHDIAQREYIARRHVDGDRHRAGAELRVGRQRVERLAVDPDIDDAIITRQPVEFGDQQLAFAACLGKQAERAGHWPLLVCDHVRRVRQRLGKILVAAFDIEADRVA